MKRTQLPYLLLMVLFAACGTKSQPEETQKTSIPIVGTWQLLTGTTIENGDTSVTDYTKNLSFIKVINDTHFAFLKHGAGTEAKNPANFGAGGGTYSLRDSLYTEHLDYCNEPEWEGNDFVFTVTLHNDTLTQQGIEKIEKANVNRINIEQYVRVKN